MALIDSSAEKPARASWSIPSAASFAVYRVVAPNTLATSVICSIWAVADRVTNSTVFIVSSKSAMVRVVPFMPCNALKTKNALPICFAKVPKLPPRVLFAAVARAAPILILLVAATNWFPPTAACRASIARTRVVRLAIFFFFLGAIPF